ncbi:MAG: DUF2196 domain-containing protein [Patescibacteria group bacterium]
MVQDILTSSDNHSPGIKVQLESDEVVGVKEIYKIIF